jgi:hypothetical protein
LITSYLGISTNSEEAKTLLENIEQLILNTTKKKVSRQIDTNKVYKYEASEETDPLWDEMISNQNVRTSTQRKVLEKLYSFRQRVEIAEDEQSYLLDGTIELERTSNVMNRLDGPNGEEKYYGYTGDTDKYEDNRQWGNQIDDILTGVLLGDTLEQVKERYREGVISREYAGSSATLTNNVIEQLYEEFQSIKREHPDAVIINQQVLFNAEKGIAGTADILLVQSDGTVQVYDLKTSINPTDGPGNKYRKKFPGKSSKADRHRVQLSIYTGMLRSQGIFANGDNKTVHIHLTEVVDDIVKGIVRETDKPHTIMKELVNEMANDEFYEGEGIPDLEKSEDLKYIIDEIKKTLETKRQKLAQNNSSAEFIISNLLTDIANTDLAGAISAMVTESYNTLRGKDKWKGYFKILNELEASINEDAYDPQKAVKQLNEIKELFDLYAPIINEMSYFYNEFYYRKRGMEVPDITDPNSMLGKMKSLSDNINDYSKKIHTLLPIVQVEILYPYIQNAQTNFKAEAVAKKKAIEKYKENLKKRNLKQGTKSWKRAMKRLEALNKEYNMISGKSSLSKKEFISMLRDGNYRDINNIFDVYVNPAISSPNEILASFAMATKEAFENARHDTLNFQFEAITAFEEFRKKSGRNRNNVKKFNEGLYRKEKVFTGQLDELGEPIFREEMHFINEFDLTAYSDAKAKAWKAIEEGLEKDEDKAKAKRNWYRQNMQNIPKENLTVNGVVIRKGLDSILETKKNEMGEERFKRWLKSVTKTINGKTVFISPELTMPSLALYGNKDFEKMNNDPALKEYYNFLISSYFTSQSKLPPMNSPGFRLPSIVKYDVDRITEKGGIKDYLKYKADSLAFSQEEDYEVYGDKNKVIPVLFTQNMKASDVSVDLISSILRFEDAANLYQARAKMAPLGETLLEQVQSTSPLATNSRGMALLDRAAKSLGIEEGVSAYAKKSSNNVETILKGFMDMQIYGKLKKDESIGNFDFGKLADTLIGIGSFTNIMGDPILGVANWLQGGTMAAIESKAKRHYSPANWAKGLAIYNKHVVNGTFIKDFNQPFDKSLIGQIIDQYDAVQGTTRDKFGRKVSRSAAKKLFASDTLYFNMAQGEHHIQVSSLLAMLHKKKVKDKDGKEIPLYEAYELDSEGKIKLKEGIDTSTLKLSKNGIVDVTTQNALHSINKSLHGVYNNFDQALIQRHGMGRLLLMYRKFIVPGFKRRWQVYSVNYEEGYAREGMYNTFFKAMIRDWKGLAQVLNPFVSSESLGFTENELVNIRRSSMELGGIIMLTIMIGLLRSIRDAEDDETVKWALSYPLYWSMRLKSEMMYYSNPKDLQRSFRSPTAAYSTIEKAVRFVDQFFYDDLLGIRGFEEYQRDSGIAKKGDPKSLIYLYKLLGINGRTFNPEEAIKVLQLQTD